MRAHEHFAEGQRNLAQAETAIDPTRLIGLATGHFLAAQTLIQAATYRERIGLTADESSDWYAAEKQQFGPDGKPARR